jgi:Concanavalin A-like lectin/glucanases superfamily
MNKTILNIIFLVTATSLLSCNKETNNVSWRFINAPDMHNVEGFSNVWESAWENKFQTYEEFRRSKIKEMSVDFNRIQKLYQTELFVSPGDCGSGRWDSRWGTKFRENFRSVPEYAQLSNEEIVLEASKLCYTALNEIIYSSGFKEFFMAVGDHEIGDNPWPQGSEIPTLLPFYKQGFANSYTLKTPGGESRFDKPIGNVMSRPIGTIYENTSNAVQYKNVLFVTLDVFRYDGEDIVLGEEGLICGDISGNHLKWFESVLKEAQNIPSIDHIIVQAHLPIIYPVRKYASSGMLMTGTSNNILLKTMRKYKVDMYLAGEVHMNTVTKDPESDLVQFVGRGNGLSNYSVVEVEPRKLIVKCYKKDGSQIGDLIIDKSGSKMAISGSGELKPFDPNGLHIHWTFDEKTNKNDFSSNVGEFPYKNGIISFDKEKEEPFAIMNIGQFGNAYSLFGDSAELVDGIMGKALEINQHSKFITIAMGPMYDDFERTISCWINTSVGGRRLILNSNSQWRPNGQFFNVGLNEGKLELAIRPEIYAIGKTKVNDGEWHHIAIVVPKRKATLAECKMYIDGEPEIDISCQNGESLIDTEQSNWMTIATQSDAFKTDLEKTMNITDFTGKIDDFCLWTRSLNSKDIKSIYDSGLKGESKVDI